MAKAKSDNLADMSDKQLMSEWTKLGEQVEKDRARLREFSQEHQRRERLKQLNLEPGDIELLQSMSPEAIETAEAVMTGEEN